MPTLRAVLEALGPAVTAATGERGLDADVAEAVLVGPGDPLPDDPAALLVCTDALAVRDAGTRAAGIVLRLEQDEVAAWREHPLPVLAAHPSLPWHHLLQLLATATSPGTTGDLFALANAIAAAVGGAVAIEDPRRRVLAYSSLPGQPIDETRQAGILGRQVPDLRANDASYREVQRAPGVVRVKQEGVELPRLAVAVRSGVELLGTLWVVEATPLGPEAEQALLDAGRLAALHLLRARAANEVERRARGELLRALLDGRSAPEVTATRLSIDPAQPVTVLGFALPGSTSEDVEADAVADLVHVQCAAASPRSSVLLQSGTVYALVPGGQSRARLAQLAETVVRRAGTALQVPLRGALGATVEGIGQALRSRADVDAVLRLASDAPVVAVEDVLPQVVLLDLRTHLAAAPHLRLPALATMVAHDAAHGTPYAESVLAYLAANADVPAAAESVNVHANTFRYRLRRVRELFDLDLEDPDVRLVAWLQLRVKL